MQQKSAFLWAGAVTAAAVTAITFLTGMLGQLPANAAGLAATTVPVVTAPAVSDQAPAAAASSQVPLEEAIRQSAAELDALAQPQVKAMLQQVDQLAAAAEQKRASIKALQTQVAVQQSAMAQDAQNYADALAGLQAQEVQMRTQLEETVAQLEAAYAQLAAQQSAPGSNGSSSGTWNGEDGHDEHEGDEHEGHSGEHDEHDEHDEHG